MNEGVADPSKAFLENLLKSVRLGHRLDDPRNMEVLQRWVSICRDIPDGVLTHLIPQTLRSLLRHPSTGVPLREQCGISPHHPLQHEAIAPYVISYRRYMEARGHDPKDERAQRTINDLRAELRALREQFNSVFDQIAGLENERERLSRENESLQQRLLAEKMRGDDAERRLEEAREKAFRLYRLYLYMLKEERGRLTNDPRRERLLTAEIAVETHAATLEALGVSGDAERHAREILGETLFAEYFHDTAPEERGALRRPSQEEDAASPAPSGVIRPLRAVEERASLPPKPRPPTS